MASPSTAALAYANLARITDAAGSAKPGADAAAGGANFAGLLKDALNAVNDIGQKSDKQAQAMMTGKANIVDVVTAVSETEVAVEAMVSVRDKVISAYEEIMRMPI